MKTMRILTAFVILSAALMASSGVTTAQAEDSEVVLCKTAEALCSLTNQYPAKTVVKNLGTEATFLGNLQQKCKHTEYTYETLAQMGDPLPILITQFEFTGCEPCKTVKAENLPYTSSLSMDKAGEPELVSVSKIRYQLSGCTFETKCTFTAEKVTFQGENAEPGPLTIANAVELTLVSGLEAVCGGASSLDATWHATSPSFSFSLYEL
jgi:hypothetical protein